jgi:hypothetical protein
VGMNCWRTSGPEERGRWGQGARNMTVVHCDNEASEPYWAGSNIFESKSYFLPSYCADTENWSNCQCMLGAEKTIFPPSEHSPSSDPPQSLCSLGVHREELSSSPLHAPVPHCCSMEDSHWILRG